MMMNDEKGKTETDGVDPLRFSDVLGNGEEIDIIDLDRIRILGPAETQRLLQFLPELGQLRLPRISTRHQVENDEQQPKI